MVLGAPTLRWAVRLVNRPVSALDCARMGVTGILHTGLTVSDLERSIAFYRDLLGLELIQPAPRA